MTVQTHSQAMAKEAYARVMDRKPGDDYQSFARNFPSLIHSCGLAQAVHFALAKRDKKKPDGGASVTYLKDLAAVLQVIGHPAVGSEEHLAEQTRNLPVAGYLRLSRDALQAADWLKRYVEATDAKAAPSGGK